MDENETGRRTQDMPSGLVWKGDVLSAFRQHARPVHYDHNSIEQGMALGEFTQLLAGLSTASEKAGASRDRRDWIIKKEDILRTFRKHSYPVRYDRHAVEQGMNMTGFMQLLDELRPEGEL